MSNGPSRDAVLAWLEARIGRPLSPAEQADVLRAAHADGDDAETLMQSYAAEFNVDMAAWRPDLHHDDDSALVQPGWPIHRPPAFGLRLPVSLTLLHASALAGRWVERLPDLRPTRSLHWLNLPLLLVGLPALTALIIALVF